MRLLLERHQSHSYDTLRDTAQWSGGERVDRDSGTAEEIKSIPPGLESRNLNSRPPRGPPDSACGNAASNRDG